MLTSNWKVRSKFIVFIILVVVLMASKVYAVVSPTQDFYVNDYANLLSQDTKSYIMQVNQSLQKQTGAQIVVVTVPSLKGASLEEYATQLFREFGIGDKTKNNGLLLLLSLKERKFRVEVGYGLEGILPDAKTGRIQDEYMIPYLKENKWDEGIRNGFNAFLDVIVNDYGITITKESPVVATDTTKTTAPSISFFGIVVAMILGSILRIRGISTPAKWLLAIGYLTIFGIISFIMTGIIINAVMSTFVNGIFLLIACFGRGFWFFGGGRPWRRLFWRRLFRWRRFLRRWRKF